MIASPILVPTEPEDNDQLVYRLHAEKLKKWRKWPLVEPDKLLSRLLFAIKRLPRSIAVMTNEEIRVHLTSLRLRPCTRFEVVRALNEVLKFIGRTGISNPRPARLGEVSYVPMEEFLRKCGTIREDFRIYLGALYACGARFSELPAVELDGMWARIHVQLRPDRSLGPTKNKTKRSAAILPGLQSFIMAYNALPREVQGDLCIKRYKCIYKAARRVLGANIHTLRHSYAIECFKAGRTVAEVANWIGDSEEVTKEYYIGYLKNTGNPWK